jgi:hypothetical protein
MEDPGGHRGRASVDSYPAYSSSTVAVEYVSDY